MENNTNFKDREGGRVIGGLILVLVGAALLLRNIGFVMPTWLFSWPMILILVGMFIGFKSNFRNNAWFIISLVGLYFLVNDYVPSLGLSTIFWPGLIIIMGIIFIVRPHRGQPGAVKVNEGVDPKDPVAGLPDAHTNVSQQSSDYLQVRSVFSGVNKNVVSKNFEGGHISCVFGGSEIDLTQADINGRVIIKLEIIFGGAKLIVPPHWAVQNEIDGVFHAVDDKRSFNPSAAINPGKVLVLKGSVVFGGIEIRSY